MELLEMVERKKAMDENIEELVSNEIRKFELDTKILVSRVEVVSRREPIFIGRVDTILTVVSEVEL